MDPIPVPRIENRITKIRENYHRVPRIRKIGSLQVHTGYLIFSLKDPLYIYMYIFIQTITINHTLIKHA